MTYFTVDIIKEFGYHLTYSATTSMPKGLYLVIPAKKISHKEIVEFIPQKKTIDFLKDKHWIPQSGRMIKYVFGIPNDDICIRDSAIWINNNKVGPVHKFYSKNKLLPQTKICGKIDKDEYLLLSTQNERSFDGRYFGTISAKRILGKAVPIFTF